MNSTTDARISPVFRYQNADAAIRWLERAFGFAVHERHTSPSGGVAHAELRFGGSAIGVSDTAPVNVASPWSDVRQGIYVSLDAIDELYRRAQAYGASIVMPLHTTSYGARDTSIRDSGQHLWSFGTYPMAATDSQPTIAVALHYEGGRAALNLLHEAFGFEHGTIVGDGDLIQHAELWLGRDCLMMSSGPKSGFWGEHAQSAYVMLDDVDAHFERAAREGAVIVEPPHDKPYGSREYYARDPEGFLWSFGTYRPARPG